MVSDLWHNEIWIVIVPPSQVCPKSNVSRHGLVYMYSQIYTQVKTSFVGEYIPIIQTQTTTRLSKIISKAPTPSNKNMNIVFFYIGSRTHSVSHTRMECDFQYHLEKYLYMLFRLPLCPPFAPPPSSVTDKILFTFDTENKYFASTVESNFS
jgi:hypothetical protein